MESNVVVGVKGEDEKTSGEIINAKSDELLATKPDVDDEPLEAGQLSPLTGSYLLIVIAEPYTEQDKERIIQRLTKGLLSWDGDLSHVDLNCELLNLANTAPEGDEAKNGEKLVQWASENLVVEVLIHSQVNTLLQCMKNLLASFTRHRHIIHAGYTFSGNGSWILQDGTFSLNDFVELWDEPDVSRLLAAYKGDISVGLHCAENSGWTDERLQKESFSKLCQVYLNPKANDKLSSIHNAGITSFIDYISKFILPSPLDEILQPSDIVGNIRFSHPTLYVFPGGQGDAALFGVNGFNMLIDGGFSRKACFWNFVRHLDRLDAVVLTRINHNSIGGLNAILDRKKISQVFPQIGHFFGNVVEAGYTGKGSLFSSDGEMEKGEKEARKDDPPFENTGDLMISLTQVGQSILQNLHTFSLKPQLCFREHHIDPINLYHKVGHGKLDLYVLNPAKDSRELKEFLSKWNTTASNKLYVKKCETSGRGQLSFPVLNLVSICALVVWQPTNPKEHITRLLFPGSTPQQKIFEALGKLKHLEFLKFPVCSAKTIAASHKIKFKSEKVATEVKSQVMSSKSASSTVQVTSVHTGGSKPASATPKPPSPNKVSLPKATKTGQNREKQLLASAEIKSDTSSSTTGLAVSGEAILNKEMSNKEKDAAKEKPRRGRSETRRPVPAKRVPSSSISRDKEANKKSEKKQQVLKSTEESTTTTTTTVKSVQPKTNVRPASAAPLRKETAVPKEKTSPKKMNGTIASEKTSNSAEPVVKPAPAAKKELKYGIGKSVSKSIDSKTSVTTSAKTIADKKTAQTASENDKNMVAKDAPKKITKPNRSIPQPAAKKPETATPPVKAEIKPKVVAKTQPKDAKKPAPASTIPKPSSKTTSSTAPKPVTRKVVLGAASAVAAGAVVAAIATKKADDTSASAESKTNGITEHTAQDSSINLEPEKYEGTNGVHEASSAGATESGSEMSSLGHISVNDDELSTSERNEADVRTPSSRAMTDTDDDNTTPKAYKYQSQVEPRFEDDEEEYLVVEKSITDESASVDHDMIQQKAHESNERYRETMAADFKNNAASLNKDDDIDNAEAFIAKTTELKEEPQTVLPKGAIDIESEQEQEEQQTREGKLDMVADTGIASNIPLSVEPTKDYYEEFGSSETAALAQEIVSSIVVGESEQSKPIQPESGRVDAVVQDTLQENQKQMAHVDEAQTRVLDHGDDRYEDKSKSQININDPLPSFGLSSAVMEIENEPQQNELAGELFPKPVSVLEPEVNINEVTTIHHSPAPAYEDDVKKFESPEILVREKLTAIQPQEFVNIDEKHLSDTQKVGSFPIESQVKRGSILGEPLEVFRSESGVSITGTSSVEADDYKRVDSSDEYFDEEKLARPITTAAKEELRSDSEDENHDFQKPAEEKMQQKIDDIAEDKAKEYHDPKISPANGHKNETKVEQVAISSVKQDVETEDLIKKQTSAIYGENERAGQGDKQEGEEKGQAEAVLQKDSLTDKNKSAQAQVMAEKYIPPPPAESMFTRQIPVGTVIRTPDEVADLPVHEVVETGVYHHEHEDDFTSEEEDHGVEVMPIVKSPVLPEIQEQTTSSLTSSSFPEKADVENMEKEIGSKDVEPDSKNSKASDDKQAQFEKESDEQISKDMTKAIETIDAAISSVFESKAYDAPAPEPWTKTPTHGFESEFKETSHRDQYQHQEEYESENYPVASGNIDIQIPVMSALSSTSKTSVVITPSTPPVSIDSKAQHFELLQEPLAGNTQVEKTQVVEESVTTKEKGAGEQFKDSKETEPSYDNLTKTQNVENVREQKQDNKDDFTFPVVSQQDTSFLSQDANNERKISSDDSTASSTSVKTTVISHQESPTSEKTPDFDSSTASAINTNQSTAGSVSYNEKEKAKFYVGGDSADAEDEDYLVDTPGSEKIGVSAFASSSQVTQVGHAQEMTGHEDDEDETEEEDFMANAPSVVGPGLLAAASTASATIIRYSPENLAVTTSEIAPSSPEQGQFDDKNRPIPDSVANEPLCIKAETGHETEKSSAVKGGSKAEVEKFNTFADQAKPNNSTSPQQQVESGTPQFSSFADNQFAQASSFKDDKDVRFTATSGESSSFVNPELSQPQEFGKAESQAVKESVTIKSTDSGTFSQPGAGTSGKDELARGEDCAASSIQESHKLGGRVDSDSDNEIMPEHIKDKNSRSYYEDEGDAEDYDLADTRTTLEKLAHAEYEAVTGKKSNEKTEQESSASQEQVVIGKLEFAGDRQTQDVISKLLAEQAAEDDTWRKMETIEASDEEEIPHHFSHEIHTSEGQPKVSVEQTKSIQKSDDGKSKVETTITTKIIEHPVKVMMFQSDDPAKIQEFKDSLAATMASSKHEDSTSSTTATETIEHPSPFSQTKTTVTTTTVTYPPQTRERFSSGEHSDTEDHEKIRKDSALQEFASFSQLGDSYKQSPFGMEQKSKCTSTTKEAAADLSTSKAVHDLNKISTEAIESHKSSLMKDETSAAFARESGQDFVKSTTMKDDTFSTTERDVSNEKKASIMKDEVGGCASVTSESKMVDFSHSSGSTTKEIVEECRFRIGSTSSTLSTDSEDTMNTHLALQKELIDSKPEESPTSTSYNPFQQDMKIEPSSVESSTAFDQKAFGSPITRRFSVQEESQESTDDHQKLQRRASEMESKTSPSTTPFVPFKAMEEVPRAGTNPFSSPSSLEIERPSSSEYTREHEYETMKVDEQKPFKSTMYGQQLQHPDTHYFSTQQPLAHDIEEEANSSGEFSDSQLSTMPPRHLQYAVQPGVRQRQGTFDSDNDEPGEEDYDDDHGYDDPDVITPTSNANTTLATPSKIMDIENANATITSVTKTGNANTISTTSDFAETKGVMTTSGFSTSSSSTSSSAMNFGSTTTIQTQYHTQGHAIIASEEDDDDDIVNKWGKPLGLPGIHLENGSVTTTEPPSAGTETPKRDTGTSTPKKSAYQHKKRSLSARPYTRNLPPIYVDLAYVPHHGNSKYSDSEFFRLIRSRYYVFSGLEPSRQVFEGLLRGKQAWDDKNLEVTIVPTYDTDSLAYWVIDSEDALHEAKIDLAPSASRCTINLQDHDTSCSAYRLEF